MSAGNQLESYQLESLASDADKQAALKQRRKWLLPNGWETTQIVIRGLSTLHTVILMVVIAASVISQGYYPNGPVEGLLYVALPAVWRTFLVAYRELRDEQSDMRTNRGFDAD
jgi:hypothetical protein